MSLSETRGPDEGSMTVVFACPACGHETAMLTNAMETQVVRSLGVTIGGRTVPSEPMEMVRSSLRGAHGGERASGDGGAYGGASSGGHGGVSSRDHAGASSGRHAGASSGGHAGASSGGHGGASSRDHAGASVDAVRFGHARRAGEPARESKCPFTGIVENAYASVPWTESARERAEKIPAFARGMAMKGVEDYARERGYAEVSESVLDEVRGHFGF